MRLQCHRALWLLLGMFPPLAWPQAPPMTLRQAIDRAMGQNPQSAIAKAGYAEATAAARQARTQLLPQLSFTEDVSRGNDPVYAFGQRLRQRQFTQADFALNALNRPQPIGNFASRFSGSWTIFDSFKTERQIRRADFFRQSATSSGKASDQQIVLQVVGAYQSVLYAQRQVDVAEHEQETAQALLTQVDQHVKAGLGLEADRMSAEVNAAARKEDLIAARGQLELAWADLGNAMGSPDLQPASLQPIEAHTFPQMTLGDELALAAKTRPDLAALSDAAKAQGAAVGAARSDYGPRVNAYGNWEEDRGSITSSGGNNWVAGVQISIDILPLGKRDQLARETAMRQQVEAQQILTRNQVRLEVSRAHIQRETAEQSLETARAAMDQAAESLRILRNRYDAGLTTITDLLRAGDAERQSQSSYWRAVYGNAMAYAQLLYAEGTLTPETAEVLQ
ncbi:MAG TPA: TolC family protein [Terracidiphilus sp.]|nr:TolC family protein [Terracidiphilus sp.]